MKNWFKVAVLVAVLFIYIPITVLALTLTTAKAASCKSLNPKMDMISSQYVNNYQKHLDIYKAIVRRTRMMSDHLSQNGYNVAQVSSDLDKINTLISKFTKLYTSYSDEMQTVKNDCKNSDTIDASTMQTLMDDMNSVKGSSQDIKDYISTNLRTDLINLKFQEIK